MKTASYGKIVPGVLAGILVLYVLSPGPLIWMGSKGYLPEDLPLVGWFLRPLVYLYMEVPAVKAFYDWYLRLFGVAP